MLTPWGETLDRENVLQEYPRPQLRRDSFLNLNGLWNYAISAELAAPAEGGGEILVPFSPESVLSGVSKILMPGEFLWYRRRVTMPEGFNRGRLLLHFGAVDQEATVIINGIEVAHHIGGFTPFSADITDIVAQAQEFELGVCVRDETDCGGHTRGKQRLNPGGIWHSAQSGIWQTVWLESVPQNYIKGVRLIPHLDVGTIEIWVAGSGTCRAELEGEEHEFEAGSPVSIKIKKLRAWSPETPFLYDLKLRLGEDEVFSYFAMRSFSVDSDMDGVRRLFLNGKPYFHNGVLDQGHWPDGLLTAPSDEAMIFDIEAAKKMGFNTIRKHMKIEPLRFYYHCDRLGMLVWQDMPCGGERSAVSAPLQAPVVGAYIKDNRYGAFSRRDERGRAQFVFEIREMINHLYNSPCVAMWVPFNEGWGQFDSKMVCDTIYKTDKSRIIDHASGAHDQFFGETSSKHVYKKYIYKPDKLGRAVLLSEFGGLLHRVEGHCFSEKEFGYRKLDSANSLKYAIWNLYTSQIKPARELGLSAAIYTQLCDVEEELSGIMTYDRKVKKIPAEVLATIIK